MPKLPKNHASPMRLYISPFPHAPALAKRFGLPSEFPLRQVLDAAGMKYRSLALDPTPSLPERRRRIQLLEREARAVQAGRIDRAEALARLLFRSGGCLPGLAPDVEHCFDRPPELEGARVVFPKVLREAFSVPVVARIVDELARARGALPRRAPGARTRSEVRILVLDCAAIWLAGTGRAPTVSTKPSNGKRAGQFLEFTREVARCLGVEASTDALWALYSRWKE